jgi:hypothetical protein
MTDAALPSSPRPAWHWPARRTAAQPPPRRPNLLRPELRQLPHGRPKLTSRAGPGLFNVVGRKAAGVPNYNYTDALAKAGAAGKTWTREELDVFLRDPNKDVPGTAMPIGIADAKAARRRDRLPRHADRQGGRAGSAAPPPKPRR